jgi:CRISPR-associated protein Cmr3
MLSDQTAEEFKPEKVPAFWSTSRMVVWLADTRGESFLGADASDWPDGHYGAAVKDARFHSAIDAVSGAAKRAQLFMTVGLDCTRLVPTAYPMRKWPVSPELSIAARVRTEGKIAEILGTLAAWSPFGGERRIARWTSSPADQNAVWSIPEAADEALRDCGDRKPKYVRMVLATPAIFRHGWLPGWLVKRDGALRGTIPGTEVVARLIGACVGRWKPISGWSFEHRGEKPARRLVPAGSVYFLEIEQGSPQELEKAWLQPVSDDPQDQRDGFGLALWGVWEPFNPNDRFEMSTP